MQPAEVRLDGIGKSYGDQWVVRNVNLHIRPGEFFTFLGPSGCGKTTLLRIIAGFVFPDEGKVYLDGQPVNQVPPWQRNVGLVFQNYALWPHMTVYDNVAFGLRERKVARSEIERRVTETLKQVDLQGTGNRRPSQLSGGQQQRVALARTLVIQPRLLLLDEPLSNLDAKLRIDMRIELLKLQRDLGLTTIYVTHDQEEALALSTRIAVINEGRVVQESTPRQIYEQPANEFVAAFVGESNLFSGKVRQADERFIEVQTDDSLIIRAASAASDPLPQSGDEVLLGVRPEAMELRAADNASTGANQLTGHVAASAYQGAFVEYEIQFAGRSLKTYAVNPKGRALFQRGQEVVVTFAADDVVIVRSDEE
jgi:iron(III) transport system ATP-binding protein